MSTPSPSPTFTFQPWHRVAPRVTIGHVGRAAVTAPAFGPILVLGPQRSRKTTSLVVPPLIEWPGPALVVSTGTEVSDLAVPARVNGYTMLFDPAEMSRWPEAQIGWSPLDYSRTWEGAQAMARIVISAGKRENHENGLWHDGAVLLLAPHFFAAAANNYTMRDIVRWINTQEEFEVRSLLQAAGVDDAITIADSMWSLQDQVRASIYATAMIDMEVWRREEVLKWATSSPRFSPDMLLDGASSTLYVCTPPDVRQTYRSLSTAVAWGTIRHAYDNNRGFASSILGLHGPTAALDASRGEVMPLLVVLDDAGAVAAIPDLGGFVSTAAKVAVQLVTVFSDLSQMQAIYGEVEARSIVNSHPTVVVMPGSHDSATADLVDELLRRERPDKLPGGAAVSDAVRRLPQGKSLCIMENQRPTVVSLRSATVDPDLLRLRGIGRRWSLRRAVAAALPGQGRQESKPRANDRQRTGPGSDE